MYEYCFPRVPRRGAKGFFAVYVFADAIVEVNLGGVGSELDRKGRALGAVGAVGGAVRGIQVTRRMQDRRAAADDAAHEANSGTELAQALRDAVLIPLDAISCVRVEKGVWKARRLLVETHDGAERTYTYTEKAHPRSALSAIFGQLIGDRFSDAVG